jgi:hypothetical protein
MSANAGFLVLCVAIYVLACEVIRSKRMKVLGDLLKRERNRNRFGQLRTRLVALAIDQQVDTRSWFFPAAYRGLTALMRNPHDFEAAAQAILTLPASAGTRRQRATPKEVEIALDFAKRLDLLCRDYSRPYAVGAWVLDLLGAGKGHPLWIRMHAQSKKARSLFAARERLESVAIA